MTKISMDPEVMAVHGTMHEEAVEAISSALNGIPTAVDGGIASDGIAEIMTRVGNNVDALYRVNGALGGIVRSVASDTSTREEDIADQLTPIATEVENL